MRYSSDSEPLIHGGGCHCGRVRFEVEAPAALEVEECNCSICEKTGYLHLLVPRERFRLLSGDDVLTEYRFNTGTARHLFCSVCGVKSFYVPRSHPHGISVNARCLDPELVSQRSIRPFDGRNWERDIDRLVERTSDV
ncbi:MAG TPA: GFA family protein [Thermoanaerobaculia bacterium]|nr:GFA family protein [Thermoanaerobaculia bacterium]